MSSPAGPLDITIAVFTQQVSNYHAARYWSAATRFSRLSVLSLTNSADFDEFLSRDQGGYVDVKPVYANVNAYAQAIADGAVWSRIHDELAILNPAAVVLAGWSFPESLAAIAWAKARGVGVVMMSESQAHDSGRSAWREAIKRRVVSACDAALVGGGPHRDYIRSLGIADDRICLGYDAVDNNHFARGADAARLGAASVREQYALPPRYLLASARFIPKKNLPRLVEAYSRAIDTLDAPPHLVILGDGPERASVESAIARANLHDKIHLPSFRGYDQLPVFYGLADGFVHVSTSEQWGLVINEAAAAGLPLVVSRPCGAASELVREGENGFLVDPHDVAHMALALRRLITLTIQSPEHCARMGQASRNIVADWGLERFASGLQSACAAALSRAPRKLAIWDEVLFRALARLRISKVA